MHNVCREKRAAEAAKEEAAKRSKRWATLQQQAMHRRLKAAQEQIVIDQQQPQQQRQQGSYGFEGVISGGLPGPYDAAAESAAGEGVWEGRAGAGGYEAAGERLEGGVVIAATQWRQESGAAAGSLSPRSMPLRQSKGGSGKGVFGGGVGTLERRWQLNQRREAPLMHIEARHQQAERQAREFVEDALLQQGIEAYKYVEG